jgi:hypothetical protein
MLIPVEFRAAATVVCSASLTFGLMACEGTGDTAGSVESGLEPGSVEWKIRSAMSAAPPGLAAEATIMDWATGSTPALLRAGTNGWTCYPSAPNVPFDDPKCADEVAELWVRALGSRTTPPINTVGVSYMLAGGGTGSVHDPFVQLAADSEEWLADPPHVMLYFPQGMLDDSQLPTDPGQGGPWLMWAGTPYVHIMVPTAPVGRDASPELDRESVEWMSQNAMSAGPEAAVQGATIIGWASGRGSEAIILRAGSDEWRCATDSPVTPVNDPICLDRESWRREQALGARVTPELTSPGIGYMLQGGVAADLSDPWATAPPEGRDWVEGGPHFMLFLPPGSVDLSRFPDEPSPGPWVHHPGTVYAHLMIPVR